MKSITDITYDNSGNPLLISFADGGSIKNVYSSTGERLRTVTQAIVPMVSDPMATITSASDPLAADAPESVAASGAVSRSTVEYHGPVIYRNGAVDMVLFPGGYATLSGSRVTFHYYTQDYLGNNRAVINGSTGTIEQTVAYYPYGGVIADLGTKPTSGQPYKFGGKELITSNGLNEYDFGARRYFQAVPHFTSIDPLCEKRPDLSPYLYCANNPVNLIDPTGKVVIGLDDQARQNILYSLTETEAQFVRFDENGVIDVELLNKSTSESEIMTALKTVVNSQTNYYVATSSEYTSGGRTRELKDSEKGGTAGVTLMPNAEQEPSPDNNIYIYTSNKIPIIEQV